MEIPTRDNAYPRPRMGGFVPAFESPKRVPLRSAMGLQRGRVGVHGHSLTSRRLSLGDLAGTYSPGQCSWDGSKWVGSAVQPTGVCATDDNNYGPPCPGGQVSLAAHAVPLPYFGVGNLMGLLQETINRGGACPADLLAGRPQAEINWLCMALGKLYAQWKSSGCVDIHGGSGSFTIGGQQWYGDNLGPIAEFAATGHCSQDIFLNACPSSPVATEPALTQITNAYGQLTLGTQPTAAQIAANTAALSTVGGSSGGSSAPSITTGGSITPSSPSTPAVANIVGGIVSDNAQLAADHAAATGSGSNTLLLVGLAIGAFLLFGGGR